MEDCKSQNAGKRAENLFLRTALYHGWALIRMATANEDINLHFDMILKPPTGKDVKVDIKAMKRIRRSDSSASDDWTWLELHSVRPNNQGWLYSGMADIIAFETQNEFMLVRRACLISFVEKFVDVSKTTTRPSQARYCIYSRPGRHDKITLVEIRKIENFCKTQRIEKIESTTIAY